MVIFRTTPARENLFVNPDARIAQEGTSFAAIAHGTYSLDGWEYLKVGTMVHTVSQDTDTPTVAQLGYNSPFSIKADCTTADASMAAGDLCSLVQNLEGNFVSKLFEKPFVIRFWHKHTKTGTHSVSVSNGGADRSFVREYTQSVSDTWEEAILYFDASPSAGTWYSDEQLGFRISWALASGTTFSTTADAWNTGNFTSSDNQVNNCDSVSNNFLINSPCIYAGTDNRSYYSPPFEQQLNYCERYFEKSYDFGTAPGTATGTGSNYSYILGTFYTTQDTLYYRTPKRVAGTVTIYNTNDGTAAQYSSHNAAGTFQANRTAAAFLTSEKQYKLSLSGTGVGGEYAYHQFTADARL